MKVAISGASGLVGRAVSTHLEREGHEVVPMVRRQPGNKQEIFWDPEAGKVDAAALEGIDAVVHLAGENVGEGAWTEERKAAIYRSRVEGTRLIATTLASLKQKPKVFVCASAIGFYGDRGDAILTEKSGPGEGFLAELVRAWENASRPAADVGIRLVNLRIGVVLSTEGGALSRMITPFRLGLGGKIGSGEQYFPWIAGEDVARAVGHVIGSDSLTGPVNATAPDPVTNAEFTSTLAKVLKCPAIFPLPATVVKLAFGKEKAEELLLVSARVIPARLQASGFEFRYSTPEEALRSLLA